MNMIDVLDLRKGVTYKGKGRNFNEGVWDGKGFVGIRHKCGFTLEDTEYHWDNGGTFMPYEEL